jgi:hypothetical protein
MMAAEAGRVVLLEGVGMGLVPVAGRGAAFVGLAGVLFFPF